MTAANETTAGEYAKTLKLFRNNVARQMLQIFLGYNPTRKRGTEIERIIMSIARLSGWGGDHCAQFSEERRAWKIPTNRAHRAARERIETATTQLIGKFAEFVKHWLWNEVTVEEDGLSREEGR